MSLVFDCAAMQGRAAGTSREYASKYGVSVPRATPLHSWVLKVCDGKLETLDHGKLYVALAEQLEEPWAGWDALWPWRKRLFYILAEEQKGNGDVVEKIKHLLASDGFCEKEGRAFAEKHAENHAFGTTVLLSAMMAGMGGDGRSIAPMSLAWLPQYDPVAWLLFSNRGRPTPFADVAGIVAHHAVEVTLGKPVDEPTFSTLPTVIMNQLEIWRL